MNYLEVLDQVRTHVAGLFHNQTDERLTYHNLEHTEQVVQAVARIGGHYQLSDPDFFVVSAAAWFHDTGYLSGCEQHELKSAAAARAYLTGQNIPPDLIVLVENCILATRMPQQPTGLLEQILCDADLFHLGTDQFKERNKLMRREASAFCGKTLDKNDWRLKTIGLLEGHQYHTTYARDLLTAVKTENLASLKEKAREEIQQEHKKDKHHPAAEALMQEKLKPAKKKKAERPDKGIETMFRITSGNHQRLSGMADNKAHIMISTNSIILSVILSVLLRKLEDNPHLIIPTLILLVICVVTMVFSILATRPSVPPGTFSPQEITDRKVNLLFFGNFYRMSLSDYTAGMEQMMEDSDFLYGSLIRDLYSQGVVLGKKYRLLRIAYNVFMFGIVAAVLAFIIAIAFVTI